MASFVEFIRDIKSLKIQGAQNVAISSLDAIKDVVKMSPAESPDLFTSHLLRAKERLVQTRPTEPGMRNALEFALLPINTPELRVIDMKKKLVKSIDVARKHLIHSQKEIAQIGKRKIKKRMVVYTHCHSSTVTAILTQARKNGVIFSVHNTETRPRYQGRKTASELAAANIPVEHYVDSAMFYALERADLVLLGVDAITSEGFIANKVGTLAACQIAKSYDIPVYFCTDSWKFDPLTIGGNEEEIEERDPKEVWGNPPKGVKVKNYAFDLVPPNLATGVISELGILPIGVFLETVIRQNPWMGQCRPTNRKHKN